MGTTANLCGVQPKARKKQASKPKGLDVIKEAYSKSYSRGFEDEVRRLQFLLDASGVKLAEDLLPEESVEDIAKDVVDEGAGTPVEEDIADDAEMDAVPVDQDGAADALIEQLLQVIEDPTIVSDDNERDAVLESAETFENEELKEGQKTASVQDMLEARLSQYYDMMGYGE